MSDGEKNIDSNEREKLLSEIDRLEGELRRRLLALIEHPGVSDEFKSNSVVKEWIK